VAGTACSQCSDASTISLDDSVQFDGHRARILTAETARSGPEERAVASLGRLEYAVAKCAAYAHKSTGRDELGADLLVNRTHLCPHCPCDLTVRSRAILPSRSARVTATKVQDARAAVLNGSSSRAVSYMTTQHVC